MFQVHSIRIASIAALGVLLMLWGGAQAGRELKAGAAELEVQVQEVQGSPGQGERQEVLYRMKVISVLRSTFRVKPGDIIFVRSYALSNQARDRGLTGPKVLSPGWLGIAYLSPDPEARGPEARRQFVIAANGDSFEDIPLGPPAVRWTQ